MDEGNKIETKVKNKETGGGVKKESRATRATPEMGELGVLEKADEAIETQTKPPTLRLSGPIWSCPRCGFTTHFNTLKEYKVGERRMALDIEEIQPTQPRYDIARQVLLYTCPSCGHEDSWSWG